MSGLLNYWQQQYPTNTYPLPSSGPTYTFATTTYVDPCRRLCKNCECASCLSCSCKDCKIARLERRVKDLENTKEND